MQFRPILDGDCATLTVQDLRHFEIVQEPLSTLPRDSKHIRQRLLSDP
jgi:hypothetical protein